MVDGDAAVHFGKRCEKQRSKSEAEDEDGDDEGGKHGGGSVEFYHD